MTHSKTLVLLFVVLLLAFGAGVAHLFRLRFEAGDIYPAYSSLRADPLGTKAFYESLRRLPEISVRRHHQPLSKLREVRDTTVFFLGATARDWRNPPESLIKEMEAVAAAGGRIVITFIPQTRPFRVAPPNEIRPELRDRGSRSERDSRRKPIETTPSRDRGPNKRLDEDELPGMRGRTVSLRERWGVDFTARDLPRNPRDAFQAVHAIKRISEPIPESVSWHTALRFSGLDPAWRVIYDADDQPVLIERPWRLGSLVLSADSYLLSNEAMRSERRPELLTWLLGPSTKVLFDETHLGIEEEPGLVALARTYRLQGLLAGLLLLAGLFVWKNSLSFVPPYDDNTGGSANDLVVGQDSTAGLVQLLRRNISARDILNVCFAEWKKSHARGRADWDDKLKRMEKVVEQESARPAKTRDPVGSYQSLSRILTERKSNEH